MANNPTYLDGNGMFVDPDGMVGKRRVVVGTGDVTLGEGDSNTVYIATKSSATQTFTLPAASLAAGVCYTFICGHASGEINVVAAGTDDVIATVFAAVGADADTSIVTTTDKGVKNTGATNAVGDQITLVSDGVSLWYGVGIACGIWATL